MTARTQLPGMRRLIWLRNTSVRFGVLMGIYAAGTLTAWLLVANHVAALEPYAGIRNLVAGAIVFVLLVIPVLRFRREPAKMFLSGLTAWTVLTLTYFAAELHYSLLESRMGAWHMFILGAAAYGALSSFLWVFLLCVKARQLHIAQTRHTATARHRTH